MHAVSIAKFNLSYFHFVMQGLEPINSCKYIYINMIYTNIISAISSFFPGNCLLHCSCEGRTAWHMKEHSIWLEQNMSTSGVLEPCNQDQLTQAFRISKTSTSNSFKSLPLGRLSEDYLENTSSAWANVCGLLRFEDSRGEKKTRTIFTTVYILCKYGQWARRSKNKQW